MQACQGCRHLYSTWRPERPRGCRAYGFESATWPSAVVEQSIGHRCDLFEARTQPEQATSPRRRSEPKRGGLYG
ncbi:MAG: uracil-DNA glycosylase [Planctomycetota bacterium]|nr:uracil-DNA glycosylase [Planctomycetota bacterium]MDG1985999.1 uracil-DNA glycosylase [Planctomycetota bacterium]